MTVPEPVCKPASDAEATLNNNLEPEAACLRFFFAFRVVETKLGSSKTDSRTVNPHVVKRSADKRPAVDRPSIARVDKSDPALNSEVTDMDPDPWVGTKGWAQKKTRRRQVLKNKLETLDQAVPQKVTSGNLSLASSRLLPLPSSCQ